LKQIRKTTVWIFELKHKITTKMAVYQFRREQLVKTDISKLWDFVSSPENLKKITPTSMGFDITSSHLPEKMYRGMIIKYRVKPLAGIPVTWLSEITQVEEGKFFVDEQKAGPYKLWHHQHILEEKNDGVLMTDIVTYKPPFGFFGNIANSLVIKKKLKEIFNYREKALEEIFG
jgi:ligand-binding SRPBCC domain-containing protein